ncbi:MAG TPA: tetratricopeptide repeat protein [Thermoanaerobaculia bacterium]|nr:tetratricopeptide repeat protein [Thermoanaerobaculia bacterium]
MNVHYGDDELSAYALAPSLSADAEAIEKHVAVCDECSARLQFIGELDDAFRDAETWAAVDLLLTRPQRLEAALAEYHRVEKEDADAEALLEPLLKSPIRFRDVDVDADVRFHTAGVVRKLCRAAHARHEKQPQFSLVITNAACRIALGLPKSNKDRRSVLALAIRERANAFRYLGRFAEGLKSLDDAEKLFDQSPGTDPFDLAVVWYIRATIYMKSGRAIEGIPLSQAAAVVFKGYGDRYRELTAVMAEASCLIYSGRPAEAAEAFERVASIARTTDHGEILARALQNAGDAYLAAARHTKAAPCLLEALALFDDLGLVTESARSVWKLASVRAAEGELEEAALQLEKARAELERLGLTNDAALATLEWAEVRMGSGDTEGVAETCAAIAVEFESEGMMRNARIALAYLHEAMLSGSATPQVVRHVRAYLTDLPEHPAGEFVDLC